MSGAQSSFVFGLSARIHPGISENTYPQAFQKIRSLEQRMDYCARVFKFGGVVANKYQVSPSFAIDGSSVPTMSPEQLKRGPVHPFCTLGDQSAGHRSGARLTSKQP